MKSIKLRTTLLGLFIILLVSNTLAAFAYINYNKLAIGEITKSLRLITHESSLFIGNLMAYQLKQLTRVAESDALKSGDIDRQLSYLSSLPLDYFETPFVADLEGNAMYLSGDTVFVGERDYFLNALNGLTGYSDFFQSRLSGDMVVVATIPIKDVDGALIGVMGAHINLDSISDIAGNKGYGKNGFSYIVNESGNIITNTNTPFSTNNLNIYSLADRNHNYVQMAQFISKSLESDEGMSSYTLNQTKNLSAFSSIAGTNWRLYIGAPEHSLYESVNNFRLLFLITTIFLNLIALILASMLAKRVTAPIIELDKAFQAAASGDLSVRLKRTTDDEIGRASINFNQMMDAIKRLTYYDPITTFPNLNVLETEFNRQSESAIPIKGDSLLLISIDQFSKYNEQYGYTHGDQALNHIGRRIMPYLIDGVNAYRGKGDEFILYFDQNTTPNVALGISKLLLSELNKIFSIDGKKVFFKFSMGFVSRSKPHLGLDELMLHATHAKNMAKSNGGNQLFLYDMTLHNEALVQRSLEEDLIIAIKEKQFTLVYQPIFNLSDKKMVDVEALIRWKHPIRGYISPEEFIYLAERMGMINEVDNWVIDETFKQQKMWNESQILSINISAHTFENENFIPYLESKLAQYHLKPYLIQLELTERVLIQNIDTTIEKLKAIRNLGVRIAVDDFGIGYSSLNYIVQLPLDSLKIDKSFISKICTNEQSRIIVLTILNMCRALNLHSIAEGIEDLETLNALKELGCNNGQGYFFSKPLHPDEI